MKLKKKMEESNLFAPGNRPLVFNEEISWQVFPSPSSGIFNLAYQANDGEAMTGRLYDVTGRTRRSVGLTITHFFVGS